MIPRDAAMHPIVVSGHPQFKSSSSGSVQRPPLRRRLPFRAAPKYFLETPLPDMNHAGLFIFLFCFAFNNMGGLFSGVTTA